MSPWPENHRPRWPLYLGITFVALGMVLGLLLMTGTFSSNGGDTGDPRPAATSAPQGSGTSETTPEPTPTPSPGTDDPTAAPEIASWGQLGRQLAVVVRNGSDQVVDQARVRITGTDAAGSVVVSTTGTANHVCCTIFGLEPGGEYGLYAPLRPSAREVADVRVDYLTPALRPVGDREGAVKVTDASLQRSADDTVVTATLRTKGPVGPYVAAQALLVDADGAIAQVISGRYWCYEAGTRRRIRLELFRAVPDGLRLDKVVAHSIPPGIPVAAGAC